MQIVKIFTHVVTDQHMYTSTNITEFNLWKHLYLLQILLNF